MKTKGFWVGSIITLIALLMLLFSPGISPALADPPDLVKVLVGFYQAPGSSEIQLIQNLGGSVSNVYHIVPAVAASVPSGNLAALRGDPRVKLVEPDVSVSLPPETGPGAAHSQMSALTGGTQVLPWGVDRIDAELVHPTNNGTGVKVAMLDTGIDLSHPDLAVAGNVTFVSGTTNGTDDNGHGTMTAGVVAALDNDFGVVGVAPGAALYAVKVLNSGGSGLMDVILSGIQWALDNNMQVINMSFGSSMSFPSTIEDALNNAYNAGIVIVAGAGNGGSAGGSGNNIWNPARYNSVIAVGGTDETDARDSSSSTGYKLEVMAPGVNIYSTAVGGGYTYLTGTSIASPHAAGVAALLIKSGITNNVDVRHRLRDSAQDLGAAGWDSQYGKGLINANSANTFSEPPDRSAPVTSISLNGTQGNNGWYRSDVAVTLSAADNASGSGVSATKYSLDSGATWLTYSSPFTASGSTLVLARSWDNAGNDEGPPAFKQIYIDQTPPLVPNLVVRSGYFGLNGWYVSNVLVDTWTTDNPGGSGIDSVEYSLNGGQTWQTYVTFVTVTTDGSNTVLSRGRDNAGNTGLQASLSFNIDKTAAVTSTSLNGTFGSGGWSSSDVTVTLTATDNASGVASIDYSLNGGATWQTYTTYLTVTAEGTTNVTSRGRDNAGNVGSPVSVPVKIDRTPPPAPTISITGGTAGNNGWYTSNVELIPSGTDNISGVWAFEYSLNGGASWQTYAPVWTVSSEGTTAVLARTRDNAGNTGAQGSLTFNIDKTPPAIPTVNITGGTMVYNGWYTSNVTVAMATTDNGSGLDILQYSLNGGASWQTYTPYLTVTADGITTVLSRGRDNAGNFGSSASLQVKIDRTPPSLTETSQPVQLRKIQKGVMVTLTYNGTAADALSGLFSVNTVLIDMYGVYSQNLGSGLSGNVSVEAWVNGGDVNGRTYTFRLTGIDLVGNQATIDAVTTITHN